MGGEHIVSVTPAGHLLKGSSRRHILQSLISYGFYDVEQFLCHLVGGNEENVGGSMSPLLLPGQQCNALCKHSHTFMSSPEPRPKESASTLRTPKRRREKLSNRVKFTIDWLLQITQEGGSEGEGWRSWKLLLCCLN